MLKKIIKKFLSDQSFVLLTYHNLVSFYWSMRSGFPTKQMYVIAVTGTNGKTSMSNLLYQAFAESGIKTSMLSTVNYAICGEVFDNLQKMSTLPPKKLNKLLVKMKNAGTQVLVIEATSHASSQGRLNGIKFDQLIVTNIGSDHIEYHGSFERYLQAKLNLVSRLKSSGSLILNSADKYVSNFRKRFAGLVKTYGLNDTDDLYVKSQDLQVTRSVVEFVYGESTFTTNLRLLGAFNVLNVATVVLSLQAYNPDLFDPQLLEGLMPVAGRLDVVEVDDSQKVVVFDYAHDPQSLENLLSFFAERKVQKLFVLFGCTGGGRDKAKRPFMGQVAAKYADKVFLTNDDPYQEDPQSIINDILSGIAQSDQTKVQIEIDRAKAIELAYQSMSDGDILVCAGKGGEKVTVIGDEIIPFDEKQIFLNLVANK